MPQIVTSPDVGEIPPVKLLNVVVLPAPLTPSRAKHSPYSSPKDVFSTAQYGFLLKDEYTFLNLLTLTLS